VIEMPQAPCHSYTRAGHSPPTRRAFYSDELRKEIREEVEQTRRQKRLTGDVNFNALWDELETIADQFPGDTALDEIVAVFEGCIKAMDTLLDKNIGLRSPKTAKWNFEGERGMSSKLSRSESANSWEAKVCTLLALLRDEYAGDVQNLTGIKAGKRARAVGRRELQRKIGAIADRLLGPNTGGPQGPRVRFTRLASRPILGEDLRTGEGVRSAARSRKPKAKGGD